MRKVLLVVLLLTLFFTVYESTEQLEPYPTRPPAVPTPTQIVPRAWMPVVARNGKMLP